jgi:hypothetical protein
LSSIAHQILAYIRAKSAGGKGWYTLPGPPGDVDKNRPGAPDEAKGHYAPQDDDHPVKSPLMPVFPNAGEDFESPERDRSADFPFGFPHHGIPVMPKHTSQSDPSDIFQETVDTLALAFAVMLLALLQTVGEDEQENPPNPPAAAPSLDPPPFFDIDENVPGLPPLRVLPLRQDDRERVDAVLLVFLLLFAPLVPEAAVGSALDDAESIVEEPMD